MTVPGQSLPILLDGSRAGPATPAAAPTPTKTAPDSQLKWLTHPALQNAALECSANEASSLNVQSWPINCPHIHAVVRLDSKFFRNHVKLSIKLVQRYRRVALDPIHAEIED